MVFNSLNGDIYHMISTQLEEDYHQVSVILMMLEPWLSQVVTENIDMLNIIDIRLEIKKQP
jgi:hypothetical protein